MIFSSPLPANRRGSRQVFIRKKSAPFLPERFLRSDELLPGLTGVTFEAAKLGVIKNKLRIKQCGLLHLGDLEVLVARMGRFHGPIMGLFHEHLQ